MVDKTLASLSTNPALGLLIPILFAMLVSTSIALLVGARRLSSLRDAPRLVPLISAIGASFFLEYTFRGLFGPGVYAYPPINALEGEWIIFGIGILNSQ